MGRIRTVITGMAITILITVVMLAFLVVCDLKFHNKFDKMAGLNYKGYRGVVLGRKKEGEKRIALFGGSVAMGYGVDNSKSIAGYLERNIDKKNVKVINLASTGEQGIEYFKSTYDAFSYLEPDVLIFYVWENPMDPLVRNYEISDWGSLYYKLISDKAPFNDDIKIRIKTDINTDNFVPVKDERKKTLLLQIVNDVILSSDSFSDHYETDHFSGYYFAKKFKELSTTEKHVLNRLLIERYMGNVIVKWDNRAGQLTYSHRTGNFFLRSFRYWFVIPMGLREKYYLIRYKNIAEGYRKDKIFAKINGIFQKKRMSGNVFTTSMTKDICTLRVFVENVTKAGKQVILALAPRKDAKNYWESFKSYYRMRISKNPNVVLIDLSRSFDEGNEKEYYSDGLHYTSKANKRIADLLNIKVKF